MFTKEKMAIVKDAAVRCTIGGATEALTIAGYSLSVVSCPCDHARHLIIFSPAEASFSVDGGCGWHRSCHFMPRKRKLAGLSRQRRLLHTCMPVAHARKHGSSEEAIPITSV